MSASSAKTAPVSGKSKVSTDEWLYHIREVQLNRMKPEEREAIQARAAKAQAAAKKQKAARNAGFRAKSALYHSVNTSVAVEMSSHGHVPPPLPAPGATQSAPTTLQLQAQQQLPQMSDASAAAEQGMNQMEAEDGEWMYRLEQSRQVDIGRDNADEERFEALQEVKYAAATDDDLATVLLGLRKEPATDEEMAAKFVIYEKFSDKVSNLRSAVEEVAGTALHDLPEGGPREAIAGELKKMDSAANTGIYDQSRYWFVHDMYQQAAKNCKMMDALTKLVETRLRMVSEMSQPDCPICLRKFRGAAGQQQAQQQAPVPAEESDSDEDLCEPKLLSCCHAVCAECWDHWVEVRGSSAACPLCRNGEFVDFLVRSQAQ